MAIKLTETVSWLNECYEQDSGVHEHVSVYLLEEHGRYILVDSGSFYHKDAIVSQIEEATDGAGIDALILSHSDYPHSANISTFREEWGNVELIASCGAPEAQGLSNATRCTIGGSMEVLGRQFSFIDPPLADRSHTTWIFDHRDGILFTADGFGNVHQSDECDLRSEDMTQMIEYEDIYQFHKETLVWLRYVDPEKLRTTLDEILSGYDIRYIAPIHGNPIAANDIETYLSRLTQAAEQISNEYTVNSVSNRT